MLRVLKQAAAVREGAGDDGGGVARVVEEIVSAVAAEGDAAVRRYSGQLDRWEPASFRLSPEEIAASLARVPAQVIDDIRFCQEQVRRFAEAQRGTLHDLEVETLPGVRLGHRHIPISAVGAYIPGGRYPMVASAHMSVVTAKLAGVEQERLRLPAVELGGVAADGSVALGRDGIEDLGDDALDGGVAGAVRGGLLAGLDCLQGCGPSGQ